VGRRGENLHLLQVSAEAGGRLIDLFSFLYVTFGNTKTGQQFSSEFFFGGGGEEKAMCFFYRHSRRSSQPRSSTKLEFSIVFLLILGPYM
jgi:hypothetical protein